MDISVPLKFHRYGYGYAKISWTLSMESPRDCEPWGLNFSFLFISFSLSLISPFPPLFYVYRDERNLLPLYTLFNSILPHCQFA
jgi:hypothetical protein